MLCWKAILNLDPCSIIIHQCCSKLHEISPPFSKMIFISMQKTLSKFCFQQITHLVFKFFVCNTKHVSTADICMIYGNGEMLEHSGSECKSHLKLNENHGAHQDKPFDMKEDDQLFGHLSFETTLSPYTYDMPSPIILCGSSQLHKF